MSDKKKIDSVAAAGALALFAAFPTSAFANVDIEQLFFAHAAGNHEAAVQAIMACCDEEQSRVAAKVTERVFHEAAGDLDVFARILAGDQPMQTYLSDHEAQVLANVGITNGRTWEGNGGRTWEGNGGRTWQGSIR